MGRLGLSRDAAIWPPGWPVQANNILMTLSTSHWDTPLGVVLFSPTHCVRHTRRAEMPRPSRPEPARDFLYHCATTWEPVVPPSWPHDAAEGGAGLLRSSWCP